MKISILILTILSLNLLNVQATNLRKISKSEQDGAMLTMLDTMCNLVGDGNQYDRETYQKLVTAMNVNDDVLLKASNAAW